MAFSEYLNFKFQLWDFAHLENLNCICEYYSTTVFLFIILDWLSQELFLILLIILNVFSIVHLILFIFFRISIGYKRKNTFLKRPPIIPFWSASIPASKQPRDYFSLLNLCVVVILCTYSSHVFTNFLYFYRLEPVCCKKQQKNVPGQLLVWGIGDLWRT